MNDIADDDQIYFIYWSGFQPKTAYYRKTLNIKIKK
jgi:hypothetical protein